MQQLGDKARSSALRAVATEVARLKETDALSPVTVIAPSHIAGGSLRRYLARNLTGPAGGVGVAGVDVTTLPRLAERLAALALAREGAALRRPLTQAVLVGAWRSALVGDAGVFAEVADHAATGTALARAYGHLRDIDDDTWRGVAAHSPAAGDVIRMARAVRTQLVGGWYDEEDLLDLALARVTADDATSGALGPAPVVVFLPQDLTVREQRLIRALQAQREVVVVDGATGDRRADRHLYWLAASVDDDSTSKGPVSASPAANSAPPTATRIVTASDSDDEVRYVVRAVVQSLADGVPADRIAVLYSSITPYARLLHEHLRVAGVTINGPGTTAVVGSPISRFLLTLLDFDPEAISRQRLFDVIAEAPVRDQQGDRVPVSVWERVSRAAGVVSWPDRVSDEPEDGTRLGHYIERELKRAEAFQADERLGAARAARAQAERARALAAFVGALRADLQGGATKQTWADLTAWAEGLLQTYLGAGQAPPSDQHAAAAMLGALQRLTALDAVGAPASVAALTEALRAELEREIPRVGTFGDGVFVGPISHGIGLDLDVVRLVGMSEDLCPGRSGADAVLPEALRERTPGLDDAGDRLARTHRHVLLALASARTSIASFPRGDLRTSGHRLPSRFLLPSLRALSNDPDLTASEWERAVTPEGAVSSAESYAGELLRTESLATEQEWRTRSAVAGTLDDAVVHQARELNDARHGDAFTRFDGNLAGLEGLPTWLPDSRPISPTALEAYASCPHAYFVGRLLRIEPIENPESLVTISAMEIGNLIHHSLDDLIRDNQERGTLPAAGAPWSVDHHAQLQRIATRRGHEMAAAGLTGHRRLWEVERSRIALDLTALLEADDGIRAERGAEVLTSEMPFGMRGADPLTLRIGEATVHLRGAADKVDRGHDGTLYVTDLKTGSSRTFKDISQDDPTAGASKLQLPAYALAARESLGTSMTPVRAEYLFVRRDKGLIGIDLDDAVEQTFSTQVGTLTRAMAAGIFPPRPPDQPDFAWVQCAYCNPDGVGHGLARERWERQRHDPALRDFVTLVEPEAVPVAPDETAQLSAQGESL